MKIDELITALQPLAGWRVHAVSEKFNDVFPCYAVRRLAPRERESGGNVILTFTKEPEFDRVPGLVLLAKDVIRVDWCNGRAWMERKENHLGYIERGRPIEEETE